MVPRLAKYGLQAGHLALHAAVLHGQLNGLPHPLQYVHEATVQGHHCKETQMQLVYENAISSLNRAAYMQLDHTLMELWDS